MKRLFASAVLLSATLVATALFIGTSSSALAAGTLTVDKPNDSVRYVAGMSYSIEWTPGNAGATVKIELLKASKCTKWVTKKTANDGEFIWKIPKSAKKNTKYKIKITSTKNSNVYDRSDNTFTIYNASNWWKEEWGFDGEGTDIGIEDDGAGGFDGFIVNWWNPHNPYHVGVVNKKDGHPVRKGKQSYRFERRPGQCGPTPTTGDRGYKFRSERTELVTTSNPRDRGGNNRWYAWSIYHKNFKFLNKVGAIHVQIQHFRRYI